MISLQCFGVAGRLLFSSMESESDIFEYLLFERGVAENIAQAIDDFGAYGCLAASAVFLLIPLIQIVWPKSNFGSDSVGKRWLEIVAAIFVFVWSIANALSHTLRGELYSELTLGEVAVRIACPIVLLLLLNMSGPSITHISSVAKWLLTLAISVTFAVHGYKAILLHGPFVDLILLSDVRMFGFGWEQETVEAMLWVIGWLDVFLAIALLLTRWRIIAVYMLVWGFITAISRTTAFGWPALQETIVRAANWGAPLVLLLIWRWETGQLDGAGANCSD